MILSGAALLGVMALIVERSMNGLPVPAAKLGAVRQGATRAEVETLLGRPARVYDTNQTWAYSRWYSWPVVYVHFDEKGSVQNHECDY